MNRRLLSLALLLGLILTCASAAAKKVCDGPAECCGELSDNHPLVRVQLGLVLVGLYNVDEKAGTWDADFYLTESWPRTLGFSPATEIVNEMTRQSQQFDTTELRGERCIRSRRIHSTLHTNYNLRTFPFDHQRLLLEFSDAESPTNDLLYARKPAVVDFDAQALDQLSSWKVEGAPQYERSQRAFKGDDGAPTYEYASFSIPVRRHITFHLTRFFLPLFVIVAVAFTVFWIDPEDLNSKVGVGVTCLLAAIAFQLAESGMLPEVEYITLADRIYAICYTAIAVSLMVAIYGNSLARRKTKVTAIRVDRFGRVAFPALLLLALTFATIRAFAA